MVKILNIISKNTSILMNKMYPKFLFISKSDLYGGASLAGYRLHKTLCSNGYLSKMVVLNKLSKDRTVLELKPIIMSFFENSINNKFKYIFNYRIGIVLRKVYKLFYDLLKITGREVFFYPTTYKILKKIDYEPDFICLYNISEGFFDIRILKDWHKKYNIIYHLSDLWIFTGHCGVPIDCDKLLTECFSCPSLKIPPTINFDRSRKNFEFKRKIVDKAAINYLAPSKWVYNTALKCIKNNKSSINLLNNAIESEFFNSNQNSKLNDGFIRIITSAVGFKFNPYKDLETIISSFKNLSQVHKIKLIVLGEKKSNYPGLESLDIEFHNHIHDVSKLIEIFNTCDLLVHSSNIETWGFTVTEALSLGLPVIASNVGGLKDQVKGYNGLKMKNFMENTYNLKEANGFLFEKNNTSQLSSALEYMIENKKERLKMSDNAKMYAAQNFRLKKHMEAFLGICQKIQLNKPQIEF